MSTSIKKAPAIITNNTAETFKRTIRLFALAALWVPLISIDITNKTIKKAGRFMNILKLKISGAELKLLTIS